MSQYFDNKDLFLQPKVSQYGSHMVMTNVQKETKRKYLNIDTRFRDDYDDWNKTSNISIYNISLPQRINDVKSIMAMNAEIPMSYHNISSSLENNVVQLVDLSDNSSYNIILKNGIYDIPGLIAEINDKLDVLDLSNITFNITDRISTFSVFNGKTYRLHFSVKTINTCSDVSTSSADFDKNNFKSKLGWLLGFRNTQYTVISGNSVNSECFVDLNGPRYLYLVVDEFSNGNQNSFISPMYSSILNKNILAKITIDKQHYPDGSILVANLSLGNLLSDRRNYTGKVDLQRLKIQLVNEHGIPMDLNGLDFSICLEIEYE